jgi:dTDP-4-amino-4,6-dideoxygalactose transaminase
LVCRKQAVAVSSGTAALEVMFRAAEAVGVPLAGREILVPTNTFIATAVTALRAGLRVRFVDTGAGALNSTVAAFADAASALTAAVCAVHIGGQASRDTGDLVTWCAERRFALFEDAAHALGTTVDGHPAGSLGLAAAISLFPTKVATSCEGGVVVSDDEALARAARMLRDHGKLEPARNFHVVQAYNWRMSEVQAAVGLVSLDTLGARLARRRTLACRLDRGLAAAGGDLPLEPLPVPEGVCPNAYKYVCLVARGLDHDSIKAALRRNGVICGGEVYAVPLHLQPALRGVFETPAGGFPNAEDVCRRHLCLPLHERMTERDVNQVVQAVIGVGRR